MRPQLTVVGARSFIGLAIAARARAQGVTVCIVAHDQVPDEDLGTVVYCSGLAWGADEHPALAYRLHVAEPVRLLGSHRLERFIYLSSVRVYDRSTSTDEDAELHADASDSHAVYPASKIAGESALLGDSDKTVVVRLSNVFGANLDSKVFLSDIVRQAVETGCIEIRTALASSKDYVGVEDVADLVLRLAAGSKHRIYNIAAGYNTRHGQIIDAIDRVLPVKLTVAAGSPLVVAPTIDTARVQDEFEFRPRDVVDAIPNIVSAFRRSS